MISAKAYRYGNIFGTPDNIDIVNERISQFAWWWNKKKPADLVHDLCDLCEISQVKLDYFPNGFKADVVLVDDVPSLMRIHRNFYPQMKSPNIPAFMSKSRETMYIAVDVCNRRIFKHEFGHLLFNHMIDGKSVGYNLHEKVAQYAEST